MYRTLGQFPANLTLTESTYIISAYQKMSVMVVVVVFNIFTVANGGGGVTALEFDCISSLHKSSSLVCELH
jgi:hypothetical protein